MLDVVILGRPLGNDAAILHFKDAIEQIQRAGIMGDDHDRRIARRRIVLQQL